jgi:hypothetical protein
MEQRLKVVFRKTLPAYDKEFDTQQKSKEKTKNPKGQSINGLE